MFEKVYSECVNEEYLSKINYRFIRQICSILGIDTKISWSMDYSSSAREEKNNALINLCKAASATLYISGPAAQSYICKDQFDAQGIDVSYYDYSGYPEYGQMYGEFHHGVSIIDLLFNEGPNASQYMKCSICEGEGAGFK